MAAYPIGGDVPARWRAATRYVATYVPLGGDVPASWRRTR